MRGKFGVREFTYKGNQLHCKGDLLDQGENPINDVHRPIYLFPIPVVARVQSKVDEAIEYAQAATEGRPLDEVELEGIRAPIMAEDRLYVALMKFLEVLNDELQARGEVEHEG